MVFVDPTNLGKQFDRDASVLVFDKPFDDAKQFTLGGYGWQHIQWCIQGIESKTLHLALGKRLQTQGQQQYGWR